MTNICVWYQDDVSRWCMSEADNSRWLFVNAGYESKAEAQRDALFCYGDSVTFFDGLPDNLNPNREP